MATPVGVNIEAAVARPPSPSYGSSEIAPVPATVDIMPVLDVTFRMR